MNGIILLDKPTGLTSHDCVNRVRRIYNTKKVGHTGTLDPSATGVLVLCINDATKIIQFMEQDSKVYEGTIAFGKKTSTGDREGEVIQIDSEHKVLTREKLIDTLNKFLGEQTQTPPIISSIKVKGKKLYDYARENKPVELPIRDITIHSIELVSDEALFTGEEIYFTIRVHVSKGTYIRSLAEDIGKELGYPAHLHTLRRLQSGQFTIDDCYTLEALEQNKVALRPLIDGFKGYHQIVVTGELKQRILYGQKLPNHYPNEPIVFIDEDKNVLAIYQAIEGEEQLVKPIRVIKTK